MKTFAIKPFFDFRDATWPSEVVVDLPSKAEITVEQYANFVYFHIHYDPAITTTVKREVCLIVAGENVPTSYLHVGTLVPYLSVEEGGNVAEPAEEVELQIPTETEFYSNYNVINVYVGPEPATKVPLAAWSFGRDK